MLEGPDDVLADCGPCCQPAPRPLPGSFLQIALGPHSVFGATDTLMTGVAELADQLDVRLHTHLSGNRADEAYRRNLPTLHGAPLPVTQDAEPSIRCRRAQSAAGSGSRGGGCTGVEAGHRCAQGPACS